MFKVGKCMTRVELAKAYGDTLERVKRTNARWDFFELFALKGLSGKISAINYTVGYSSVVRNPNVEANAIRSAFNVFYHTARHAKALKDNKITYTELINLLTAEGYIAEINNGLKMNNLYLKITPVNATMSSCMDGGVNGIRFDLSRIMKSATSYSTLTWLATHRTIRYANLLEDVCENVCELFAFFAYLSKAAVFTEAYDFVTFDYDYRRSEVLMNWMHDKAK